MSTLATNIQKALLPLGFLVVGALGFGAVMSLSATVEKSDAERTPTPVEVRAATIGDHVVVIEGTGIMQPSAQVDVVAQVQGKIVSVADGLTPGMAFDEGQTIARIDARDYQANLVQAQSNLEAARLELQLEQSRGTQAQREWELLGRDGTSPLALRQPQLAATQARVAGAQAQVDVARLALERTRLTAPFDAVVLSESLELGQFVSPGAPVARLMGTEKFRIRVSLPVDEAMMVDIPDVNAEAGSEAVVSQRLLDGSRLTVRGTVQRLLGELDPETRTATLLVQVLDPYDGNQQGSLPILPNAYVDVAITGRTLTQVVPIPRSALVEGRKVWVANAEDVLDQRVVQIAHAGRDIAYLRAGLEEGDRIVVSPLSLPVIGMKLDVRDTIAANEGTTMSDSKIPSASGAVAWMAQNSVAANLLMLVLIVGGILSMIGMKQEVFPEFDLDIVSISVPYPGASPAEVEQGIVLAIEEAVRGVDGVKEVMGAAAEGVGSVQVEILIDADPDKVLQDVKSEIDRIRTFPEDAEDPQVALVSRKQKVVAMVISGDQELDSLHALAERARDELLTRGGVTQVEVEGIPPLEVSITVDRATLTSLGLTIDDVSRQIALSSLELPGGAIETEGGEVLVRIADRKMTREQFEGIVVRGTPGGGQLTLGGIATVVDGYEDNDQSTTFNGEPAVLVTVYRVGSETPAGVAAAVRAYVDDLRATLPASVEVTVWDDDSELLADRIDLLVRNGRAGLVLVLIVLGLFLDLRLAFWVALGIPISFMGAFFLMPAAGVSINMISLFALIITLGIVVDDAIVVGENVYDKVQEGMEPMQAAIEGSQRMVVPVTFSVLTTGAAFAPLLFVPGTTGKIFGVIPSVVLAVLFFSLLESFFVLPAHLGHGAGGKAAQGDPTTRTGRVLAQIDRPRKAISGWLDRFRNGPYDRVIRRIIDWRYAAFGLSVAVLMVSMATAASGFLPFSFLPKTEADLIRVSARMPYGTPIARTEQVRDILERSFDEVLAEFDAEDAVLGRLTLVGQGPASFGPAASSGRPVGSHLLTLEVDLVPTDERNVRTAVLQDAWQRAVPPLPGVESLAFTASIGPSGGAEVDVQLSHFDTEVLAEASQEVADQLQSYDGLINISNGYAAGKPQLDFQILPAGRTLGLTATDVARQVRSSFYGAEAVREQRGRNELKVMVRLPEDQRASEYDLEQLDIRTPTGAVVPLQSVARFTRGQAATSINRDNGRRVVDITAELRPGVRSSRPFLEDIEASFLPDLIERHPGLQAAFAGEQESQNESLSALGQNYFFALFVIYALLAIPFRSYVQPIIIMSAIPFGIVGAFGGHLLMGYELSVISVMGIIALSGVVVNDSLVLIDAANGYRTEDGMSPLDAVVTAGKRRMRPILLTSLTTFFGLVPIILETSVQARFLIPMALSLGFGVLFVTVIVLFLVPALYIMVEDLIWLGRWAAAPWTGADVPHQPQHHEAPAAK